jgi:Head domain of trimeric autotransporter adhesin
MRKLFLLFTFCIVILTTKAQVTNGLTGVPATGTGTVTSVKLGGALTAATTVDLTTFPFIFKSTAQANIFNLVPASGNIGFGVPAPLGTLHIKGGTTTAAPLIFSSGTNLITLQPGALEYNGTSLFFTPTSALGRKTVAYSDLTNLSGILPVANGGTGASTNTGVLIGNGTSATTSVVGGASQYLRRNAANTAYEFAAITVGTGTVTSVGLTMPTGFSVAPAAITSSGNLAVTTTLNGLLRGNGSGFTTGQANLATEVTGTLPILNGGTGATTAAGALTALLPIQSAATTNQVLKSNGASLPPTWATISGTGTVTNASIVTANGISGTVATSTTTPAITLSLGAITPTSTNGVSAATMAFVDPTSSIQTQLNNKQTVFGSQAANTFFAAPNTIAGSPTFRTIMASDIPILNQNTTGNAATASTSTNLTGGSAGSLPYQTNAGVTGMLAPGANNNVLTMGANGLFSWMPAPSATATAWGLSGNAGTNPLNNFIGTTDAKDFVIKTNGVQLARFSGDGNNRVAIGSYLNTASGNGSTALGYFTTASGSSSFAVGSQSYASGEQSTAMGSSVASGLASFAVGNSTASATTASAFGGSVASGYGATSFGVQTKALGSFSIAGGYQSESQGDNSVAFGFLSIAQGFKSTAIGLNLTSKSYAETSLGLFNTPYTATAQATNDWVGSDRLFNIGNGTSNTARSDAFTILKNGNTGIGFSSPTEKLDVNGNIYTNGKILIGQLNTAAVTPYALAVNGSAIFTKATVKLNANWPDFVFEKNYKLPTLAEVEAYVAKYKHLKDVPSADEVKEKGIDLGDNQTILLKKVEELTLYMIELNKKVEALAKENEELKKKVNGDK